MTGPRRTWLLVLALIPALLVVMPACGDDGGGDGQGNGNTASSTTSTSGGGGGGGATTSTTEGGQQQIQVYFVRDDKVGAAGRRVQGAGVGRAAIEELIEGPTRAETAAGLESAVPEGTKLLDLDIADELATIDLSEEFVSGGGSLSMQLRVAQVVYTLTQFATVERVAFRIDGKPVDAVGGEGVVVDPPVDRADFEDVTPAILLESPTIGETVSGPVRLRGTANTFEAAFTVQLLDGDGEVLVQRPAMATSGTGTRGTFDVTVPLDVDTATAGAVALFEESAKDGSPINRVEVPVEFEPT